MRSFRLSIRVLWLLAWAVVAAWVGSAKGHAEPGALEELPSVGWGTLKGKVTYDGDPPPLRVLEINRDKDYCLKGDTTDQTWKVGPDKGVANVVVWLRAPKGKYFQIPDELKEIKDPVTMDQPFCAFEPHVVLLFPSYYDAGTKKQKKTGQALKILNSAQVVHNVNWKPLTGIFLNPGGNPLLASGGETRPITFKPCKDKEAGGEQLISFACSIHLWMKGYARVFDHPYVALARGNSASDKEFGAYEIKKAPAGVELELVYWHEALGDPRVLKTIVLKEGDNTIDFTIKK